MNFAQTLLCGILSQGSTIARLFGYRTGAQAHKQNTILALFWQNWSIKRPRSKNCFGPFPLHGLQKIQEWLFLVQGLLPNDKTGQKNRGCCTDTHQFFWQKMESMNGTRSMPCNALIFAPLFVPYKKLLCGCAFVRRLKTPRNYRCFIQKIAQTLLCAAQLKSHNHWLWSLLLHSCAALPGLHGLPMRKG